MSLLNKNEQIWIKIFQFGMIQCYYIVKSGLKNTANSWVALEKIVGEFYVRENSSMITKIVSKQVPRFELLSFYKM